ncbi:MAG: phosphoenolpyruvate synthase [Alistipes sp.]|uniref:PEP/pyruvate-binding domain-containing protein n=1 Tax=Alistipes sp. TaxID=1872444 RepID=UPI001DE29232|nr:PEP/pyruvate-binding domain-containing protein [Alistipes sp.]MBS6100572.1 phosphoenolpyruvate synthase [Alistipes sp.]
MEHTPAEPRDVRNGASHLYMKYRIHKILLVCCSYDGYILEEDGHIESRIKEEYLDLNLSNPPAFTRVSSTAEALDLLERDDSFDFVLTMYNVGTPDVFAFGKLVKAMRPALPIALLTSFSQDIYRRLEEQDRSGIDDIFCWHGNTDLIIALIKLVEDRMNADDDILLGGVQSILLVEDSIRFYSTYLPELYRLILLQNTEFLKDAYNEGQLIQRKRSRPKILLATNFEDAQALYNRYRDNLLGVISDVGFVLHRDDPPALEKSDAGIDLCRMIRQDNPLMPVLLQSSQTDFRPIAEELGAGFIAKNSKTLLSQMSDYLAREFAFGDFLFRDLATGQVIGRAKDLRQMQELLASIPDDVLEFNTGQNNLSKWLYSRGLFPLAASIRRLDASHFRSTAEHREALTGLIRDYRNLLGQGVIARFDPETYSDSIAFARMGQLRAYIRTVRAPLAVRSSSKLEDSHYQPFAGIYSTYMIPHTDNEDQMLRLLVKAIKCVYASVYYAASRAYIQSSQNLLSEEKMAVILQEVCGSEQDGLYLPTLSGVARSINYYPIGDERPEEGICQIAMGLGKLIVEGGRVLRFSPVYPRRALQTSTPRLALSETQTEVLALDLRPEAFRTSPDDEVNIRRLGLDELRPLRNTRFAASVWDRANDRLADSLDTPGGVVLTFNPILKYGLFPLAEIVRDMLQVGIDEMRCPVEIEFAVNMDVAPGQQRIFNLLQIRPIVERDENVSIDWKTIPLDDALIYAESALGIGAMDGIRDIVYVRSGAFDVLATEAIAEELLALNARMREQGRPYVLVGPGRWGSSDPHLGIPVKWTHISEARVIVECGIRGFEIDPSQGTHFFQNVTSLGVGYLTINPFRGDGIFREELLDGMPAVQEGRYLRCVSFDEPLYVYIDGRADRGIVKKMTVSE